MTATASAVAEFIIADPWNALGFALLVFGLWRVGAWARSATRGRGRQRAADSKPAPEHVGGYRTAAPADRPEPEDIMRSRGWREGDAWLEVRDGILWAHSRWHHDDPTTPANPDAVIREVALRSGGRMRFGRNIRLGPLCAHVGDGVWWARLWERGPGVAVKDTGRWKPLFSERNGRGVRVGRWLVKRLRWEGKA